MKTQLAGVSVLAALALGACQTAPVPGSGFLQSYEGLVEREDTIRASIRQRRDDAATGQISSLYLEPAVLVGEAGQGLTPEERAWVLREVDRQICYEVTERFDLSPSAEGSPRLRTGVIGIGSTGQAGSGVAAVANILIPGPGTFRVPGTTGGLAVETELLSADGRQVAALAWARNANLLGTDSPSTSRIGDALQMAEPFGDEVGDTISPPDRAVRDIPEPDPCGQYGPRTQAGGFLTRAITGVYVPEVNTGTRETAPDPQTPPR